MTEEKPMESVDEMDVPADEGSRVDPVQGDEPGAPDGPSQAEAPGDRRVTPEEVEEALVEAELGGELDALQSEFDDLNDRHLRLAAEFTNYRRRADSESLAVWGRAQADLVRRFLDVLDDLQRVAALDPAEESVTVESIVEGIDLVERKFMRTLEEAGTELVNPGDGDPFDPERMEAMMRVPAPDDDHDDLVAQVFQRGYIVDGNLVRPARVSVYKAD
jgi:molecular chaperone GrpE